MFNGREPAMPHLHVMTQPPPGRGHLPPRTPVVGGQEGRRDARLLPCTAPGALTEKER